MALLKTLVRLHGSKLGREKYNEWHRDYRKRNKPKMLKYWAGRAAMKKAKKAKKL
jgi:hypothetical protein